MTTAPRGEKAPDDHGGLVEPEGTNAGSADSTAEAGQATGDVLGGGQPDDAPREGDPALRAPQDDERLVGAPADAASEPGQPDGSSGQDAGSMDGPA